MSNTASVLELTREEIVRRIDFEARRRFGLSAKGLIYSYRNGTLKDCGKVADLLSLANLLDPTDQLFAEI